MDPHVPAWAPPAPVSGSAEGNRHLMPENLGKAGMRRSARAAAQEEGPGRGGVRGLLVLDAGGEARGGG